MSADGLQTSRAVIFGVRQSALDTEAAAFFAEAKPWALILFREACVDSDQVRRLCDGLRQAVGRDCVVWIDQEGGRVARLKPPVWPAYPAPSAYGNLFAIEPDSGLRAAWLGHRLIAEELKRLGINGSFAPMLDVPGPGADPVVIGDRAFAEEPEAIAALGRAALAGLHAGGVVGCVKHAPGHGRAMVDSHFALPRVEADRAALARDFAPFRSLRAAPAVMTAHVVYDAIDPAAPATWSKPVIQSLLRDDLKLEGLLIADDLDMKALDGPLAERAKRAFAAGCEVALQCNGQLADMRAVLPGTPVLSEAARKRAAACEAIAHAPAEPFDAAAGWRELRGLLARSG